MLSIFCFHLFIYPQKFKAYNPFNDDKYERMVLIMAMILSFSIDFSLSINECNLRAFSLIWILANLEIISKYFLRGRHNILSYMAISASTTVPKPAAGRMPDPAAWSGTQLSGMQLYWNYLAHRSPRLEDFYLTHLIRPKDDTWYKITPMGVNQIGSVVTNHFMKADIKGRLTNHSLKRTARLQLCADAFLRGCHHWKKNWAYSTSERDLDGGKPQIGNCDEQLP